MIIFGQRSAHLKSEVSRTAICPNCGTQGSVLFSVYRRHAHVFWIPTFPMGKVGASQCQHCKQTLKTSEMPEGLKNEYRRIKTGAKGPIWQFAGLGLFILLMVFAGFSSKRSSEQTREYIKVPAIGDVYKYKLDSKSYTTLKVTDVAGDSVFVSPNEYEINKRSRIYRIDKPENYAGYSYGISLGDLEAMHQSGEIFEVNR